MANPIADPPTTETPAEAPAQTPVQPSQLAPAAGDAPIEVDEATGDDNDSTVGEESSTYTASLSSSVLNYPVEHGRRYHAYRAGAYPMPNDEHEQERLDLTHHLMVNGIGGKLYLAPLEPEKVHTILDVGTGTGIWAIEMGDMFPNATVLGNDLSAIESSWVPPNVKFEIDDVESPWIFSHPFDYIFSRYMAGSIKDWPRYIQSVYDNLAPGGFAEFQDYDGEYFTDDGTLTSAHSTRVWIDGLIEAGNKLGRDPRPGPRIHGWMKEAGFKQVVHQQYKFPLGPWARDPHLKTIGLWNMTQVLEGLEGFSLRLYCDVLGWKEEEVIVLLANVRKELQSGKLHIYVKFHVAYGLKD